MQTIIDFCRDASSRYLTSRNYLFRQSSANARWRADFSLKVSVPAKRNNCKNLQWHREKHRRRGCGALVEYGELGGVHNAEIEKWLNQIGQSLAKTPQANASSSRWSRRFSFLIEKVFAGEMEKPATSPAFKILLVCWTRCDCGMADAQNGWPADASVLHGECELTSRRLVDQLARYAAATVRPAAKRRMVGETRFL